MLGALLVGMAGCDGGTEPMDAGPRRDGGERPAADASGDADLARPDAAQDDASPGPDSGPPRPLDCSERVTPLAGYTRKATPTVFEEVERVSPAGTFWLPFPYSSQFGRIFTRNDETISIRFETPTDAEEWARAATTRSVFWDESQVDGPANLSYVYVTLSTCPGDFRIPERGSVAPATDPTFARGCTTVRDSTLGMTFEHSSIRYTIGEGPSTEETCMLAPGRTYYINFVRARASDGVIGRPEEELREPGDRSNCKNPDLESCGVQMRVE